MGFLHVLDRRRELGVLFSREHEHLQQLLEVTWDRIGRLALLVDERVALGYEKTSTSFAACVTKSWALWFLRSPR